MALVSARWPQADLLQENRLSVRPQPRLWSLSSFPESGLVLGQGLVAVLPCLVVRHVLLAEGFSAVFAPFVLRCFVAALVALCHLREIPMGLAHLLVLACPPIMFGVWLLAHTWFTC